MPSLLRPAATAVVALGLLLTGPAPGALATQDAVRPAAAAHRATPGPGAPSLPAPSSAMPGPAAPGLEAPATSASPAAPSREPLEVADLPVPARDVTDSDRNLAATGNEVTVLVDTPAGPEVMKLRADSRQEAATLATELDAAPGVVAALNQPMRALEGAVNPEPMAPQQWNLPMVGAPDAWATSQGAGVTVAVIDTGVDASHPDLAGRVLPEIDLLPEVLPQPSDTAHGTRVASLIAGILDGAGMAGVAPAATILPVAALDLSGVGDSSTVARAIIAAAEAGARVINLSLGGPDPDPVLDRACSYAYARGAVLVAAAGNSYQFGNEVQYPAASPHVVAVAAVDATGTPAAFSNTGSHIALAAPGQDVWAAIPGGGYDVQSGTSFAAPQVAGALALVMAANPVLSTQQVVSVTELTAQDDASGNGRDTQLGFGIVRADRAVAAALSMQAAGVAPDARLRLRGFDASPEPITRGTVATLRVTVQARFTDGVWRPDPLPSLVRFEFRPSGAKRYRHVGVIASGPDGVAALQAVPTRSGTWRAKVKQANGSWTASGTDKLRVRR